MKGMIRVRHRDDVKITHSRRYLRIEGISIEITDDWEDIAKDLHSKHNDLMWRTTLERIIRKGLTEYLKKQIRNDISIGVENEYD